MAFFFLEPFLLVVGESPGVSRRLRFVEVVIVEEDFRFPDEDDDDEEPVSFGEIAEVDVMAARLE